MPTVAVLGTCDTKLDELLFLYKKIVENGQLTVLLIDVGRSHTEHESIDITQRYLLQDYGSGQEIDQLPRNEVISTMAGCATKAVRELLEQRRIQGIISAGGSCGTSLASSVMRDALPIGFPKMIVSTVASGDTGPIVEETDITLMYSVVDIAGLNQVLRNVLSNAAFAIAGMATNYALGTESEASSPVKKRVGITMFGVTTPAVDTIRKHLESKYEIETYIFHATGHGGKAMERLVREGVLEAVLDLTTTEICDHITGGVMSAGPKRLEAAARAGIPNIISVGATDMTNFGPKSTVPERYKDRKLYEHNSMVTLMRTSEDEARQISGFIVEKLQHAERPDLIQLWLPKGGISLISTSDGPFVDAKADSILFQTLRDGLKETGVGIVEDERAINDPSFATDIAEALVQKLKRLD